MICKQCGADIETSPCPYCSIEPAICVTPSDAGPTKKRNKFGLVIALSIISVVLVAALLTCWLTNWFGFYGPATIIMKSVDNTFRDGNFTFTFQASTQVDTDQVRTTNLVIRVNVDFDVEKLTIIGANKDGTIRFFIHEGYFVYPTTVNSNGYYAINIRKTINQFFQAADSLEDLDLQQLLNTLDGEVYAQLQEVLYIERLEESAIKVFRRFNSNFWLKENAGYSKETADGVTLYKFDPDMYDFCNSLLKEFADCFRSEEDFSNAVDSLKKSRNKLRNLDPSLSLSIHDGNLVSLAYSITDDNTTTCATLTFSDVGTTQIKTSVLDEILKDATK